MRSTIECTACERSWLPNEQQLLIKGRHAVGNCRASYEISCTPTNRLSIASPPSPLLWQCLVTKCLRWQPTHAGRCASSCDTRRKKSFNRNRCSSGWYYDAVKETELSSRSAKNYRIHSSSRLEIWFRVQDSKFWCDFDRASSLTF